MRMTRYFILAALCLAVLTSTALAGTVRIEKVLEEGEEKSPMLMRSEALAEGFAQAVVDEAARMLPGTLGEDRVVALRNYLTGYARPYIQGYKILFSEVLETSVTLEMDVTVNKKNLRSGLKKLGLMRTVNAPLPGGVIWPEDINEDTLLKLQELMVMSGIQQTEGALPAFTLEPGTGKTYKARLETSEKEWMFINKDISAVWVELWGRYFNQTDVAQAKVGALVLTIAGWFSPDAALEFDRVLHGWDSAVQDVKLVELDMQPSGVGGTWEFRLLSGERLASMLNGYLPQRGLTYQLSEDAN